MTPARVLLADNNPQILALYGKYLRDAGYHVATADSPATARQALDRQWFDLAVIDWRLDDDSEGDHSGYELAGDPLYSHVAKIILTLYPDWQKAVKARTAGPDGCAPAFDYIGKEQTLREFGDAVARALAEATPTDRALLMADATQRRLVEVAGRLRPPEAMSTDDCVYELEVLVRRLFCRRADKPAYRQVVIERFVWDRPGRVAVVVYAYPSNTAARRQYLVVAGLRDVIEQERARRQTYLPTPPPGATQLGYTATTARFAANAYALPGADLEQVRPLGDAYRQNAANQVTPILSQLAPPGRRLGELGQAIAADTASDDRLLAHFGLPPRPALAASLAARLDELAAQAAALDVAHLERTAESLIIRSPRAGLEFSLASPLLWLAQPAAAGPLRLGLSPGRLAADTILVDGDGRPWLTDLLHVTEGPLLADFAALETVIKFEAEAPAGLADCERLESLLLEADRLDQSLRSELPPLRKTISVIAALRHSAAEVAGDDLDTYHAALFYAAAAHLLRGRLDADRPRREVEALVRVALSLGRLAGRLLTVSGAGPRTAARGVQLFEAPRRLVVDGRVVEIKSPQQFAVLLRLVNAPGQWVTRQVLYQAAYKQAYDDAYQGQFDQLIYRIREKLGETHDNPRYLFSAPDEGYALFPHGRPPDTRRP